VASWVSDVSSEFYYPRTDAGSYLERGIPIIQFFNGLHPDYHRPTDDVAKLDIAKIVAVSKRRTVRSGWPRMIRSGRAGMASSRRRCGG
jgi:hypothetical protein